MIYKGLRKHQVKLYDNIDQLPVDRFTRANKFWMLHDNIGSSIEDFDKKHFSRLVLLAGDKQKCLAELDNLRVMIYNIMNEINVEHLSFACLVHSIDGDGRDDLSEDGLRATLRELAGMGLTNETLKKKRTRSGKISTPTWRRFFPSSSTTRSSTATGDNRSKS